VQPGIEGVRAQGSYSDEFTKHGVKYHQLILGKPRRRERDEYHYIDDTPIRATRYKGVFGDKVKKTKDAMVFEDE
jgi:hypothetical protein